MMIIFFSLFLVITVCFFTLTDNKLILFISVCKHIITRVLDISDYDTEKSRPNFVMTLHQFMTYFTEEGGIKHVEEVATESK